MEEITNTTETAIDTNRLLTPDFPRIKEYYRNMGGLSNSEILVLYNVSDFNGLAEAIIIKGTAQSTLVTYVIKNHRIKTIHKRTIQGCKSNFAYNFGRGAIWR